MSLFSSTMRVKFPIFFLDVGTVTISFPNAWFVTVSFPDKSNVAVSFPTQVLSQSYFSTLVLSPNVTYFQDTKYTYFFLR